MLGDQLARPDPVLDRWRAHHAEHRHQLLGDERMRGEVVEVRRERGEQHLVLVGGVEARQAGEADARLPEHVELHLALVRERARRQRRRLRVREEPGAHPLELLDHLIVDLLVDHARLLCRADHRGVERLRDQDVDDHHPDVGAAVHVDRGVAGADAETWLAGGVRRRHRLRPAGRPDEVDPGVVEQVLRDVERWVGDDLQRVRRQPRRLAGLLQELAGAGGAACGGGRRAHDQGVACLRADDRLEQRGRRRVGDRQERQDDPDRLSDVFEGMLSGPRRSRRPTSCPSGSRRGTRWRCSS